MTCLRSYVNNMLKKLLMARSSRRFDSWHVMLKIKSHQFATQMRRVKQEHRRSYSMLNIILITLDGGVSRGDIVEEPSQVL